MANDLGNPGATSYGGMAGPASFGGFSGSTDFSGGDTPAFEDGGFLDDEGLDQDDYMLDPMEFVGNAMDYGREKYGIKTGNELGFDDGGVVPTAPDPDVTANGNPNAIDPRQAMAYLTGDGAVSPEIARALEQRIDPQGQLDPTQRAMAAIGVAPNDEARFGLLQHYRTKYNAYAGAAKAALAKGDMGEAAQQATMAMDSVPNGSRTQFAPTANGLAMINQPSFQRGGGRRAGPPQQRSFARGGYVQSFQDGSEVEEEEEEQIPMQNPISPEDEDVLALASEQEERPPYRNPMSPEDEGYTPPRAPRPESDEEEQPALQYRKVNWGAPQQGVVPTDNAGLTDEQVAAGEFQRGIRGPGSPLQEYEEKKGAGGDTLPPMYPSTNNAGKWVTTGPTDEPTMPDVAPQVLPAQAIVKMLDEGFDAKLEAARETNRAQGLSDLRAPPITQRLQQPSPYDVVSAGDLDAAAAQQNAQLQGWESAAEKAKSLEPPPGPFIRPGSIADRIRTALTPEPPPTPAPTTGSEAATRTPENTYPVTQRGQEQRFPPAGGAAPATAPVTRGVAPTAAAEGAVVDETRVDPFTGQVRRAAPGTFGSREAARRAGTEVPANEAAARRWGTDDLAGVIPAQALGAQTQAPGGRGVVPTGDGTSEFPTYKTYAPPPSTNQTREQKVRAAREAAPDIPPRVPGRSAWPTPQARRAAYERGDRTTVHPSGYDPSGAGAFSTQRVPGYGPGLREQMGDPSFYNPNYKYPGGQQPYVKSKVEEFLDAHEKARRIPNNFGNSTGTLNIQTRPGSTERDFLDRGGAGPSTDPMDQRIAAAERQAARMYPKVSDEAKRSAAVSEILKRADEYDKAIGVEELRGEKAKQGVIGASERTQAGITSREKMAADKLAWEREKQEKAIAAKAESDQLRNRVNLLMRSQTNASKTINEMMRSRPELVGNPMKLQEFLEPHLATIGITDPKEIRAVTSMFQNEFAGGADGGGRLQAPDSRAAAGRYNVNAGDRVPVNIGGNTVYYIVGPDGNGYTEEEYKKRFGKR